MLTKIRTFFNQRAVLEVETPLLCHATGTDPQLDFFSSFYHCAANKKEIKDQEIFLQTSPEFAMKRLLAAGSGSIYQICKAFRNGESGSLHNPEFSILEWYRVGFTLQQLMDETTELLIEILSAYYPVTAIEKFSYCHLFENITGLNPLIFCPDIYKNYATENDLSDAITCCSNDHSMWLDFIFSFKVQAELEKYPLCMVYGYPAIQSSLARINSENSAIADRVEVFVKGIEIANGFLELLDRDEQEKRFDEENKIRHLKGLDRVQKDMVFLDALSSGLPDCSGIALGLDRLLMILANVHSISEVIAFPFDRA